MATLHEQAAALRAQDPLASLSSREREVFDLIAVGTQPQHIATRLDLSVKTISTYRARILEKLKVRSNAELARLHANVALAVAADHTLIAAALCAGIATWKPFDLSGVGELCVGGMRFAVHLDPAGVPELYEMLRHRLAEALELAKAEKAA